MAIVGQSITALIHPLVAFSYYSGTKNYRRILGGKKKLATGDVRKWDISFRYT